MPAIALSQKTSCSLDSHIVEGELRDPKHPIATSSRHTIPGLIQYDKVRA